jgi:hypothetical protein
MLIIDLMVRVQENSVNKAIIKWENHI